MGYVVEDLSESFMGDKDVSILFGGDIHKRPKDITTIEGYVNCNIAVQRSLMKEISQRMYDLFISMGDWYDKGYVGDVAASLADYDLDIEMSHILGGRFYGVIGNHIRLNLDSNPELHIIQPHPVYKTRRLTSRDTQIMKTPDYIRIRDVQISLVHFNKEEESNPMVYKTVRQPWAKYHIAVYHTQAVVPNSALISTNYGYNATSNSVIAKILEGVDFAIVGHIHDPIGQFTVNTVNGATTMVIPGSLTNVDAGERGRHSSINMPLITIDKDSNVKLQYLPFDLKLNLVTFKKKEVMKSNEKLKTLRGNPLNALNGEMTASTAVSDGGEVLTSLNAFMAQQGYTSKDKSLIRSVMREPEKVSVLLDIYAQET